MNVNCQTNDTCRAQRVDSICIGDCCCTVPKLENGTGPLSPLAQPLRDSPQKSLAQKTQNSMVAVSLVSYIVYFSFV
jgi:hypothetical protein